MTTFSFHPVKTITTGEGGAIATKDPELLARCKTFRNHGLVRDPKLQRNPRGGWHQEVQLLGLNYRMSDILAALGSSQLRRLTTFVDRRRALTERYREAFADLDGIRFQKIRPDTETAWHLFVVRVNDGRRGELYDALRSKGIGAQVHFLPIHLHPLFEDLGYRAGMCPVAEACGEELLSLPLFAALTDVQQDRVIDAVRSALKS
jgi:dTDP-4-amino-4,6-dideoxygalactose transaminase